MNKKLSPTSRRKLVASMNELIAECPLPEARQNLINSFSSLLIRSQSYLGFGYVAWDNGGYQQWLKDGKPEDNTKYLGDQTMIKFT